MPPEEQAEGGAPRGVGLVRDLGLLDITLVGVGAMIGAGIFVLTGIAAGAAGPALILAFALNGIVTVLTAMVYAELGSAIPEAGGGYLWVKEGMPAWNAFMAGWMSWFAHAVAGSLYALGFGSYFELVMRELGISLFGLSGEPLQKALAVVIAVVFVAINFRGVSETGKVGNLVTMAKIAILGVFVVSGMTAVFRNPEYLDKLTPFAPNGMAGILIAMGLTYIAFEGYEIIVQAGEEVKNPRENIPKAVFLSLAIVIPIYMLVAFTALAAVNPATGEPTWQWLGLHAELGLAEAARQFMPFGTTLLLVGGLFSTMSALNATTFSSTRVSFAMGRDRNLPDLFGRIHDRTRTPYLALVFSGSLIIVMAVAIRIEDVAAAADVMFLLLFLQVNVAVITIRKKYGDKLDYGYLIPFHPVLPMVNMALIAFLAAFMFRFSPTAWFAVIGWLGLGFALYLGYASRREREKTATPVVLEETWKPGAVETGVLVPIPWRPEAATTLIAIGERLARSEAKDLLLLHVATVPPQTPLRADRKSIRRAREILLAAEKVATDLGVAARGVVRVGHRPSAGIVDMAEEAKVEWIVMGWHRRRGRRGHFGRNIDTVMREASRRVLAVHESVRVPARRIAVAVADPDGASDLVALGRLLLDGTPEARVTALHVIPPGLGDNERAERVEELEEALRPEGLSPSILESREPARAIVQAAEKSDLLIVGSAEPSWSRRRVFGRLGYQIALRSRCPVIVVNLETHTIKFGFQTFFQFFRDLRPEEEAETA